MSPVDVEVAVQVLGGLSELGKAKRSMTRLYETWDYIKAMYFPAWDRKGKWKVVVADLDDCVVATCVARSKTIYLSFIPDVDDPEYGFSNIEEGLSSLLIHEICHAIDNFKIGKQKRCIDKHSGHGEKWQSLMLEAADRAAELGKTVLSECLKNDVDEYKVECELCSKLVYEYKIFEDMTVCIECYGEGIEDDPL